MVKRFNFCASRIRVCWKFCARRWVSRAPRKVATTAIADRATLFSMACWSIPVWYWLRKFRDALSQPLKESQHRMDFTRCNKNSLSTPPCNADTALPDLLWQARPCSTRIRIQASTKSVNGWQGIYVAVLATTESCAPCWMRLIVKPLYHKGDKGSQRILKRFSFVHLGGPLWLNNRSKTWQL